MAFNIKDRRFRAIFNASPDAIAWGDTSGRITFVNLKLLELTGFSEKDFVGKTILENIAVTPESKRKIRDAYTKRLRGIDTPPYEIEIVTKSGEIIPAEMNSSRIYEGAKIIGTISIIRDLKERKKAVEKFETYLNLAGVMMIALNSEGVTTYVNRKVCEVLKYTAEEIVGKDWFSNFLPKRVREETKFFFKKLLDGHVKPVEYHENPVLTKDGEERLIAWHNILLKDEKGEIIGHLSSGEDITESRNAYEMLQASETRFRELADLSPSGIFEVDLDGNVTYVNQSGLELFGYSQEEFEKGMNTNQTIIPEEYEKILENRNKILRGEKVSGLEYTAMRKDGTTFPAYVHSSPIIRKGEIVGLRGIIIDITDQKKVEEILRISENRFRELTDLLPSCVYELDLESNVTYMNRSGLELYGYTQEDFEKGLNTVNMMIPKDYDRAQKIKQRMLSGEAVAGIEYTGIKKDGTRFIIYVHSTITKREGKPVGLRGIAIDITERKKTEEEIGNLAKFPSENPNPVLRIRKDGIILYANYASEYWLKEWKSGIGKSVPKQWNAHIIDVLSSGKEKEVEFKHENQILSFVFTPITDADYVNIYGRDITSLKIMEEELRRYTEHLEELVEDRTRALQESEEFYRSLIETSSEAITVTDLEGKLVMSNLQAAKLYGFESVKELFATGKTAFDYITPEDQQRALENAGKTLETGRVRNIEYTMLKKDGTSFPGELSASLIKDSEGKPKAFIGVVRDLTEYKRMEQLLLEAKRLATIGETAGMVGHDLRNPLQAIVNTIYLANIRLESLPSDSEEKGELKAYLDTVERQVGYMNKIVSDLLDYARPIHPETMETSIYQLIQGTLLSMVIPETVEVSINVPENLKLMVDAVLMRRVFVNLFTNAIQAMLDGGKLTITVSKTKEDVLISIEDTGVGISEANMDKLFHPLFTTKSKGQGFGLPVCKRIIDAHGGDITVKSKLGKGSIFTVKLPQ